MGAVNPSSDLPLERESGRSEWRPRRKLCGRRMGGRGREVGMGRTGCACITRVQRRVGVRRLERVGRGGAPRLGGDLEQCGRVRVEQVERRNVRGRGGGQERRRGRRGRSSRRRSRKRRSRKSRRKKRYTKNGSKT